MSSKTLTPLEQIQALQLQINKQIDSVKIQFAKELEVARKTFVVLTELGVKDIWSDPQYVEVVKAFGIGAKAKSTTPRKPRTPKEGDTGKLTVADAIVKALEDGATKNIAGIKELASEIKGSEIPDTTVNQTLGKLVKEGKIKKGGDRGTYQKA